MCEIAAAVGPVLEIDMDTIAAEYVRAKVGVRDTLKIPKHTEFTASDLSIYRVLIEMDSVVEKGWFTEIKRPLQEAGAYAELEFEGDVRKRHKINIGQEQISLGSLSLSQYEEQKIK